MHKNIRKKDGKSGDCLKIRQPQLPSHITYQSVAVLAWTGQIEGHDPLASGAAVHLDPPPLLVIFPLTVVLQGVPRLHPPEGTAAVHMIFFLFTFTAKTPPTVPKRITAVSIIFARFIIKPLFNSKSKTLIK